MANSSRKGVAGGTIRTDQPPLCRTCRNARYIQGNAETQRMLVCTEYSYALESTMPYEAYECSEYDDKRLPSKSSMEDIAWILRTDPKAKGQWGFVSPEQRKKEDDRSMWGKVREPKSDTNTNG